MKLKKFIDEDLIPDDGSKAIISRFSKNVSEDVEVCIYPDMHYKKGAALTNGLLICSNKIFPACLGVENCGFTVGKVLSDLSEEQLQNSFLKYSEWVNNRSKDAYKGKMKKQFREYLKKKYIQNEYMYTQLNISSFNELLEKSEKLLDDRMIDMCEKAIGNLGGGNHFFELHRITDCSVDDFAVGDVIFMLHSDSISIGDYVNLMYSNLSELDYLSGITKLLAKLSWRKTQLEFFFKTGLVFTDFANVCKLLFSRKIYRSIDLNTKLGKRLILDHNLAGVFGDMNRDCIINDWADINNIKYSTLFSHSHDSVNIEEYKGKPKVIHRNGVQYIRNDKYCLLPGAMGTKAYILRNLNNKEAHFSTNHGAGRFEDKHIANSNYTECETVNELVELNIKLYRVGKGLMSEQNQHAFKDVDSILKVMEKYNLGEMVAKSEPFAVIKG